ncbi:MAG: hypothetical protein AABZ06_06830 [Bdellovibrionota bacterium]
MKNQNSLCLSIQIQKLQNGELLSKLIFLAQEERKLLIEFLVCLREFDLRKLYLEDGYSSLFSYLTQCLGFSEGSAYRRIQAARLSFKYPLILERLEHGKLTLSALSAVSQILTQDNCAVVLSECEKLTKRGVEKYVATEQVRRMQEGGGATTACEATASAPVPPRFRDKIEFFAAPDMQLTDKHSNAQTNEQPSGGQNTNNNVANQRECEPAFTGGGEKQAADIPRISVAKAQIRIQFTASAEMMDEIEEARAILSHRFPNARLEDIFGAALNAFLDKHSPKRRIDRRNERAIKKHTEHKLKYDGECISPRECAQAQATQPNECELTKECSDKTKTIAKTAPEITKPATKTELTGETPPTNSRHISQAVRDMVWQRDQGRCSYVSPDGKRCDETMFLEYHHEHAWAQGGSSQDPANIALRCKGHNALAAVQVYGAAHMNRFSRQHAHKY